MRPVTSLLALSTKGVQRHRLEDRREVDIRGVLAVHVLVAVVLDVQDGLLCCREGPVIRAIPLLTLLGLVALLVDSELDVVDDGFGDFERVLQAGDHVVLLCGLGQPLHIVDIHLSVVAEAILALLSLVILALFIISIM